MKCPRCGHLLKPGMKENDADLFRHSSGPPDEKAIETKGTVSPQKRNDLLP